MDDQSLLLRLFGAALDASQPAGKFASRLPELPKGRTIVIGAGKAASSMANAFAAAWARPCEGLVITRYGHTAPDRTAQDYGIEVVEAGHPTPDNAGFEATERMLDLAASARSGDLVVALLSGGASALLTLPAPGVTLSDKQAINRDLLRSGAPIGVMNRIRCALSAVKGGRLATAVGSARLVTYVISDIPGDDPSIVGSGPTIPRKDDREEALADLARYGINVSPRVIAAIRNNRPADPRPDDEKHLIVSPRLALEAAANAARVIGITPMILGDAIEGEAREVAQVMASISRSVRDYGDPIAMPCVLLSGGETTVTVRGKGRGGRNSEFLLALALASDDAAALAAIACDTDGIDGSEDNAGAWIDPAFCARAREHGVNLRSYLADNDAYTAFASMGHLVETGPTLTNVNDFRAILIR